MKKILGIVVSDYPYGYGEPFLKDEILELGKHFPQILVIIPSSGDVNMEHQVFPLPDNALVVAVNSKYTILHKITSFIRVSPVRFYSLVKTATKQFQVPFSWGVVKVFMSYVAKEYSFRKRLLKQLKKQGFNPENLVLYSYWFTEYTYSLSKLKEKYPGMRAFSRAHGWDLYFERHNPAYLPFRKKIIPSLNGTFTVSEHGRQYLLGKLKIGDSNIETHRLGVGGMGNNPFEYSSEVLRLLSIAFISPVKNLELMIEVINGIPENIQVEWYHIGDGGKYAKELKQRAENILQSKKNVKFLFLGNKSGAEIRDFIQTHPIDLFVNTSYSEGLPVSMMEALSAGIPIAGPAVGGIPEIVKNNENGYLFSSSPGAGEIIEVLIKHHNLDKTSVSALRKNAFKTWQNDYSAEQNYAKFAMRMKNNSATEYRCCSKCILDSNDYPDIQLNSEGICDICLTYDKYYKASVLQGSAGVEALNNMLAEIREKGKNHQYDCLIGVSGGVDSTYLAYLAKQWGLRPLILHVDNGWDSELAVKNIENIVAKLGFDLYTYVVNWDEMKDLQLSFFKASVVDMDVPTDNTYIASIYKIARKFNIKSVITGHNVVTEGWLPPNFNHNKYDLPNIYDIHRKFGSVKLKTIPLIGLLGLWRQKNISRIKTYTPLNYISYNKNEVKHTISTELGWRDYGSKHYENIFTRFYQGYILLNKFKVDKRKAHLSTLICSGQMTRDEALIESKKPVYDEQQLKEDKLYFIKKLGLTENEFEEIMNIPPRSHIYYKSILKTIQRLRPLARMLRKFGLRK